MFILQDLDSCQIIQRAIRCPCSSRGWRADSQWPLSPHCTTFQLLWIDLCGSMWVKGTRTEHYHAPSLSLYLLCFPPLCAVKLNQNYLCVVNIKHIFPLYQISLGGCGTSCLGFSFSLCAGTPPPLSKWHWGNHNRGISPCGLLVKQSLAQSIMHYYVSALAQSQTPHLMCFYLSVLS